MLLKESLKYFFMIENMFFLLNIGDFKIEDLYSTTTKLEGSDLQLTRG